MKHILLILITVFAGCAGSLSRTDMHKSEFKSVIFSDAQLRKRLSLEYAGNFHPPERLTLTVNDEVAVEREKLVLSATLTNPTPEDIDIIVWLTPFYMKFKPGQNIAQKSYEGPPLPQQVPPPPAEFTVPAMTQVEFITEISLRDFVYGGTPTVDIEWTFHYWNNPVSGTRSVTLPQGAR